MGGCDARSARFVLLRPDGERDCKGRVSGVEGEYPCHTGDDTVALDVCLAFSQLSASVLRGLTDCTGKTCLDEVVSRARRVGMVSQALPGCWSDTKRIGQAAELVAADLGEAVDWRLGVYQDLFKAVHGYVRFLNRNHG